jgi:para-aminobenzoate synthetase component 1
MPMKPANLLLEVMPGGPPLEDAIEAVARLGEPAILENPDPTTGRRRYTILACDPLETLVVDSDGPDPFESLRRHVSLQASTPSSGPIQDVLRDSQPSDLPFCGGWIGYFAYEAGRYIERIAGRPACDISLPIARWGLYDSAAIHDGWTNQWILIAVDLGDLTLRGRDPLQAVAQWKRLLSDAGPAALPPGRPASDPVENMGYLDYLDRVRRAKEYISAGDIFQVNLARRFTVPQLEPAATTWLRLRRCNPAPYAAFLSWDQGRSAILSASPELFLRVRGREVVTRPIKGTRPRSADLVVDSSYQQELLASEKDRAELAMIVDLERNDLGRVCEYGSVRVLTHHSSRRSAVAELITDNSDFAQLESHPSVHHLVATISGRLRDDCDTIDLLRATFPGGSITGAPKVRAMEIIDELEPTQRSVYTGAIGHVGLDGSMTLNIAIRTLIVENGQVHAYVGSGIVADSDPQDEYAETAAKAVGLCRAVGVAIEPEAHSSRRSEAETEARGSSVSLHDDIDTCRA